LSDLNGGSQTSNNTVETSSSYEIHTKIIKGNSTEIKLHTIPTSTSSNEGDIAIETIPKQPIQLAIKSPEVIDFESNHSTNDDQIEESTEDPIIPNNFKIPEYILEFQRKYRLYSTDEKKKQFFASFQPGEKTSKSASIFDVKFPVKSAETEASAASKDFTYDLELVTNKNEREKIKVSFQPGKVNMVGQITNKMDSESRDKYFRQFHFITDYRSGYAPIDIQAKQEEKEFSYKDHFIKKKQASSSARLKRTCGVSYVKALESQQLHVEHIFTKLPPLVFQGSTECTRFEEGPHEKFIEEVFENVFKEEPNKYLLVTTMEAEDESLLREYLYYPERRFKLVKGNVYLVKSLDSLWGFFQNQQFVCINLCYDEKELIRPVELKGLSQDDMAIALAQSNVQLGIICKKSTSGKKAFLKVFVEGTDIPWDEGSDSEEEGHHDDKDKEKEKEKDKVKKSNQNQKGSQEEKKKVEKKPKKEKKKKEKEEDLNLVDSPKAKKGKKKKLADDEIELEIPPELLEDDEDEPRVSEDKLKRFTRIKNFAYNNQIYNKSPLGCFTSCYDQVTQDHMNLLGKNTTSETICKTEPTTAAETFHQSGGASHSNESSPRVVEVVIQVNKEDQRIEEEDHEHEHNSEPDLVVKITEEEPPVETLCKESKIEIEETPVIMEIQTSKTMEEEKPAHETKKHKKEKSHHKKAHQHKEDKETEDVKTSVNEVREMKISNEEILEIIADIRSEPGVTVTTMSTRFELYTHEESWKTASSHTKNLLYTFITYAIDALQEKFRVWTKVRKEICESEHEHPLLFKKHKDVLLFHTNFKYDESALKGFVDLQKNLNWNFDSEIKTVLKGQNHYKHKPENIKLAKEMSVAEIQDIEDQSDRNVVSMGLPLYQISTRDSFAYDLIEKVTILDLLGRKVKKTEYFFDRASYPSNFKSFSDKFPDYRVGVTTYNDFYTHDELNLIESKCYETERKFFSNHFLPMTGQMTCTSEKVRRTKFFFGARYMWTRQQLSEAHSMVGAGIRVDVSEQPKWMKDFVEKPMVDAGIMEKDFVNSIAMNVYHDGKEGIAQHFDDAVRFKQPIYSVRIFSDSRLSFGSQLYGFCNGAFCIPMPRGCITIMEEDSYAANGIKHCVRPTDMTGKSAAIILRQMHHRVFNEAKLYDEFVDFPTWFSTLAINEDSVSYSDQKRIEGEEALKASKKTCSINLHIKCETV